MTLMTKEVCNDTCLVFLNPFEFSLIGSIEYEIKDNKYKNIVI